MLFKMMKSILSNVIQLTRKKMSALKLYIHMVKKQMVHTLVQTAEGKNENDRARVGEIT